MFIAKGKSEAFMNPKGWVEVKWGVEVDADELMTIAGQMLSLFMGMEDGAKKPVGLVDFSGVATITDDAAMLATKATRDLGFARVAVVGMKPAHVPMLDAAKANSNKFDTIKAFAGREDAEAWLLSA